MKKYIGKASNMTGLLALLTKVPKSAKVNLETVSFTPTTYDYIKLWYDEETDTLIIK